MKILKPLFKISFAIIILFMISYFIGYIRNSHPKEVPQTVDQDTSLPSLALNGYRFHSEHFGDPELPMVLVLHGGPGGDYRSLLDLKSLSDRYFVVYYDQRGSGLSPRTDEEYLTYDTAISDIESIIKYYKPEEKVILIGHSWGGMLACGFLGQYPQLIDKMVIIEPGFLNAEMADLYFVKTNGLRPTFSFSTLSFVIKSYFESLHVKEPDQSASRDYFFQLLMSHPYKGHPLSGYFCNHNMNAFEVPYWRVGSQASQVMMASGFNDHGKLQVNFAKGLNEIDTPVLLLVSTCNSIIGIEHQKEHAKLFKNISLDTISNAGHNMILEKPEECMEKISSFLESDHRSAN